MTRLGRLCAVLALALTAGVASGSRQSGKATTLTALIGSSGPAETFAVNNAAKAFTKRTGIDVNVDLTCKFQPHLTGIVRRQVSVGWLQKR